MSDQGRCGLQLGSYKAVNMAVYCLTAQLEYFFDGAAQMWELLNKPRLPCCQKIESAKPWDHCNLTNAQFLRRRRGFLGSFLVERV
jgi:hypothetical protein